MSNILNHLKYSKEHEWVKQEGNIVKIGISDYAQSSLGDIVFVELPEVGREVSADESIGVIESVKAVSDIYSPVSGKVVEVNTELEDAPETINEFPYEQGWIYAIELSQPSELEHLLSAEEYQQLTEEE